MQGEITVRHLLRRGDFRRLLATRLLSQFGDGVFQAALAGTLLFNPQRAADPFDVAAGFAVLLLPYSFVGPFAGVWLDRWSRRQVLLLANVVRSALVAVVAVLVASGVGGLTLDVAGLAVFSVNRFLLSALSAALPHTTDEPSLVSANALSTTSGALSDVAGGAVALGLTGLVGTGNASYAGLALASAVPFLTASAVVSRFPRTSLGPDRAARAGALSARQVARGMLDGARHVWQRPPAAAALTAIALHRACYGLLTLMALLLYRNTFTGGGLFPGGLVGLGEVVVAGAVGTFAAAAVTPWVVRHVGKQRWTVGVLVGGAAAQLALGLPFRTPTMVVGSVVLGFVAQAVKICVDTTLQETVDDGHRGRVFSVYDTLFNVTYVAALLAGAVLLPPSGVSYGVLVAVAVGYVASAVTYARMSAGHRLTARVG
jgi:MFS family permease